MNIYKKANLRNLTNEELHKLLNESNWYDKDLLREYDERYKTGRVKFRSINLQKHFKYNIYTKD